MPPVSDAYYDFPAHKAPSRFFKVFEGLYEHPWQGEALSLNERPVSLHTPLPKLLDFSANQFYQLGVFILFNRLRSVL